MTLFSSDNVLVPIDFSDKAVEALKETLDFVGDPAKVHALYVLPPLEATDPGVVWQTVDENSRIQKVKESFSKHFPDAIYQQIKFTVEIGSPSSEIIDYAQSHQIDLIVIPADCRPVMADSRPDPGPFTRISSSFTPLFAARSAQISAAP